MADHHRPWWKSSLVYQIYPASFYCAPGSTCPPNNDKSTVGNIRGIIQKIPYIADLGFDSIWLSPIFASPQTDMGYDISDYRSIHAPYGTVDDIQDLIDTLHSTRVPDPSGGGTRPMRLLMDLVVNHTSNEHPWFLSSSTSRTNAKADWYFWRDPKILADGTRAEPNNWRSIFGGPAWHYVESRQQYYLALFLPTQPDLNWENEDMRQAIYDDMRFWLDRGVDGWRIDSMNLMSKYPDLPDADVTQPEEKYQNGKQWYASGPRMHEYLQEIKQKVLDAYGSDKLFTVGELGSAESEEGVAKYVARSRNELHCVFHGMDLDFGPNGKYDGSDPFRVSKLRNITDKWQVSLPKFDGWNSVYLDNHDSGRSLSRYASDEASYRSVAAKLLATYLLTLSGTVFVLSGQEIGMANLPPSIGIEGYIDVEGQNWYNKVLQERRSTTSGTDTESANPDMTDVMAQLRLKARDHGRLPMQWTSEPNAGFCDPTHTPWMTINPDHKECNVESQLGHPESVLGFWKEIIAFRRSHEDSLVYGTYTPLSPDQTGEEVIGYKRESPTKDETLLILLNFSKESVKVSLNNDSPTSNYEKIFGNIAGTSKIDSEGKITLAPFEALILSGKKLKGLLS